MFCAILCVENVNAMSFKGLNVDESDCLSETFGTIGTGIILCEYRIVFQTGMKGNGDWLKVL